jgi:hypothetical protein
MKEKRDFFMWAWVCGDEYERERDAFSLWVHCVTQWPKTELFSFPFLVRLPVEICALQGCYKALSGNPLAMFWDNVSVLPSRVKKSNEAGLLHWTSCRVKW